MRVKCLAQEHNAVPRPGLEPRPFDPESSALTIRPPRLRVERGTVKLNCLALKVLLCHPLSVELIFPNSTRTGASSPTVCE